MTENRYSINDFTILDMKENPVKSIYIREILDFSSAEFKFSKLSAHQKIDIIDSLGFEALTDVLRDCFKSNGKNYIASMEAHAAYKEICRNIGRNTNIGLGALLKSNMKFSNLFKIEGIVESLTIKELSAWSYSDFGSKLRLPAIQRSIVWTNEQVINYWDSLLRGYPAGMMMIHRVQLGDTSVSRMARDIDGNTRSLSVLKLMLAHIQN